MAEVHPTRDAYLLRLCLEAEEPTAAALFRLHRAHVERIPYETLWIHLGERPSIDARDSYQLTAAGRRGGYCFHLNGAFSELLADLGYDVVRHVGGVYGPEGPTGDALTNHLALTVHGLATPDNPSGTWYVDVGLGDAMYEPLPLVAGVYHQGPFSLELTETPGGIADWRLRHDPRGAFAGMCWTVARARPDAFDARHLWLSTSPDSGFVKVLTMQRRDCAGVDALRGLVLRRVDASSTESDLTTKAQLLAVMRDVFGVDLDEIDPNQVDHLWTRLDRSHEAWDAAGRP